MKPGEFYFQNISEQFKCEVCGSTFNSMEQVARHCKQESEDEIRQETVD